MGRSIYDKRRHYGRSKRVKSVDTRPLGGVEMARASARYLQKYGQRTEGPRFIRLSKGAPLNYASAKGGNMPLLPGSSKETISKNIGELHAGKTYAHTEEKFGKEKANKQAVAIAYSQARKFKGSGNRIHLGRKKSA